MFQSHVQIPLKNKTSHDGLFQRLEDQLPKRKKIQTEIKHTIPDQHFRHNAIQKIKQLPEHILDQAIEDIQTSWDYSKIKCRVELVSSYIIQNGDLLTLLIYLHSYIFKNK